MATPSHRDGQPLTVHARFGWHLTRKCLRRPALEGAIYRGNPRPTFKRLTRPPRNPVSDRENCALAGRNDGALDEGPPILKQLHDPPKANATPPHSRFAPSLNSGRRISKSTSIVPPHTSPPGSSGSSANVNVRNPEVPARII